MHKWVAIIVAALTVFLAGAATAQTSVPWDIQALVARPTLSQVSISPDGTRLAYIRRQGLVEGLIVEEIATGQTRTLITARRSAEGAGQRLDGAYWKGDDRLLVQVEQLAAYRVNSHTNVFVTGWTTLYSVDAQGTDLVQLETPYDLDYRTAILDLLANDDDHVLVEHTSRSGPLAVSRFNVITGELVEVDPGYRGVITYFTDSEGNVVARARAAGSSGRWGLIEGRDANGRWSRIADYFASDIRETPDFRFIGSGRNPGELYAIVRPAAGSTPDTAAIHVYDLRTRTLGPPIAQHDTFDMAGMLRDANTGEALAGCYQADMWRCDFEDPAIGRQMAGLLTFFENERDIRVVSQDRARRHWVLGVSGATEPGSFYLYDAETRSVDIIGEAYGAMAALDLAEMERVDYQARDGQALHGYLTLPTTDRPGPHALIVLPHGGPEARDAIGFDPWVQFLASRGYAVFQPNFRGSSGFGRGFAEAGYRQWGQRMQDDVTDGVQALIAQGVVDPGQICIMGASYGGYAALWGGASQPDLYRCVISIAGVSDLREMLQWTRRAYGSDSETFGYWETAIGEYGRDREALEAVSPIRHVSTWRPPVLLIHGTQDYTVPVEQSQEMDEALRRAGRDVRYVEMERQGHQFTDEANAAQLLVEVGGFLALHLPTPENRPR